MDFLRSLWDYLKQPQVLGIIAVTASGALVTYKYLNSLPAEVPLSNFIEELKGDGIVEVIDYGTLIDYKNAQGVWQTTQIANIPKGEIFNNIIQKGIRYTTRPDVGNLASVGLQFACTCICILYLRHVLSDKPFHRPLKHRTNVTFADIAGNHEAKQSLREVIQYFENPERFVKIGARLPKGILLYGPCGTGKTLLAKATACEADVNFILASGSEFIEKFVGVGASRIRELFKYARQNSPCILFIDEIECLGVQRQGLGNSANFEHLSTLDQLLSEMDGFIASDQVVVLGATNKHTMLDEALLRPGRFDRKIQVSLPEQQDRLEILQLNLRDVSNIQKSHRVSEELIGEIAEGTQNFSGAELAHIINEASFMALRSDREYITDEDIFSSYRKLHSQKIAFQMDSLREAYADEYRRRGPHD